MADPRDKTINFLSSPESNAGFQYPYPGLNAVGEYMASGLPFSQEVIVSGSPEVVEGGDVNQITFPFITNEIYIKNRSAGPVAVGWTRMGVLGTYRHTLLPNEAVTFRIRTNSIFMTGLSGSATVDLSAALTMIKKSSLGTLTGSAAHPDTGYPAFRSGSYTREFGYHPGLG